MSVRTIDYEKYVLIEAMDYDGNNNLIYHGKAFVGSKKSDACWSIKKILYDVNNNPTDIKWADADDNFDKVWDNRTSYSYS